MKILLQHISFVLYLNSVSPGRTDLSSFNVNLFYFEYSLLFMPKIQLNKILFFKYSFNIKQKIFLIKKIYILCSAFLLKRKSLI